jgi:hypothetical protein
MSGVIIPYYIHIVTIVGDSQSRLVRLASIVTQINSIAKTFTTIHTPSIEYVTLTWDVLAPRYIDGTFSMYSYLWSIKF